MKNNKLKKGLMAGAMGVMMAATPIALTGCDDRLSGAIDEFIAPYVDRIEDLEDKLAAEQAKSAFYTGTTVPASALGKIGDTYLRTSNNQLYTKTASGWVAGGILTGEAGMDGAKWFTGTGTPASTLGVVGDFYLDTTNGYVYKKASGGWGSHILDIKGDDGTSSNGTNGKTWTTGSGTPNDANGTQGDLYLKTSDFTVWLKGASTWTSLGSIKGADGSSSDGEDGTNGATWYSGTTPPTTSTEGAVGDFYLNTTDGIVYKLTAITGTTYTWIAQITLKATDGTPGENGTNGNTIYSVRDGEDLEMAIEMGAAVDTIAIARDITLTLAQAQSIYSVKNKIDMKAGIEITVNVPTMEDSDELSDPTMINGLLTLADTENVDLKVLIPSMTVGGTALTDVLLFTYDGETNKAVSHLMFKGNTPYTAGALYGFLTNRQLANTIKIQYGATGSDVYEYTVDYTKKVITTESVAAATFIAGLEIPGSTPIAAITGYTINTAVTTATELATALEIEAVRHIRVTEDIDVSTSGYSANEFLFLTRPYTSAVTIDLLGHDIETSQVVFMTQPLDSNKSSLQDFLTTRSDFLGDESLYSDGYHSTEDETRTQELERHERFADITLMNSLTGTGDDEVSVIKSFFHGVSYWSSKGNLTLKNITINATSGQGIVTEGTYKGNGTLTLDGVTVNAGDGSYFPATVNVVAKNSSFIGKQGLHVKGGNATFENCYFEAELAGYGAEDLYYVSGGWPWSGAPLIIENTNPQAETGYQLGTVTFKGTNTFEKPEGSTMSDVLLFNTSSTTVANLTEGQLKSKVIIATGATRPTNIGYVEALGRVGVRYLSELKTALTNAAVTINETRATEIVIWGNITINETLTIPAGVKVRLLPFYTLTINAGVTVTNNGEFTNRGTIVNSGTMVNDGIFTNTAANKVAGAPATQGTTTNSGAGTLTNNGTVIKTTASGTTVYVKDSTDLAGQLESFGLADKIVFEGVEIGVVWGENTITVNITNWTDAGALAGSFDASMLSLIDQLEEDGISLTVNVEGAKIFAIDADGKITAYVEDTAGLVDSLKMGLADDINFNGTVLHMDWTSNSTSIGVKIGDSLEKHWFSKDLSASALATAIYGVAFPTAS